MAKLRMRATEYSRGHVGSDRDSKCETRGEVGDGIRGSLHTVLARAFTSTRRPLFVISGRFYTRENESAESISRERENGIFRTASTIFVDIRFIREMLRWKTNAIIASGAFAFRRINRRAIDKFMTFGGSQSAIVAPCINKFPNKSSRMLKNCSQMNSIFIERHYSIITRHNGIIGYAMTLSLFTCRYLCTERFTYGIFH